MLRQMRSGMKPVMFIVAFVFVGAIFLWGAGQMVSTLFGTSDTELAANVDGQKITLRQYSERYYMRLRQAEEDHELTEAQRQELAEQTLKTMVEECLWLDLAHELKLEVSKDELSDYLNVRYGIGTRMSADQYKQMIGKLYGIDRSGGSLNDAIKEFETMNHRLLLVSKAKAVMASTSRLPETRARLFYEITSRPANFDTVYLDAAELMKSISVTDTEAQTWYDAHPDYFFSPTRARLEVLSWSQATLSSSLTVSPAELEEYYEEHKYDESQSGKVRLSSILLSKPGATEATIKSLTEKGKTLVLDLRKQSETMVDPQKRDNLWWATLDKTSIEMPAVNTHKGDIGFLSSDDINTRFGKEADEALAGIFPGDITMPVLTPDGLRIFRREEDYYPLEWKKVEFGEALAYSKASKLATDYADNAQKRLADGEDPQKVAKDLSGNYTLTSYFVAKPAELLSVGMDRSLGIPGLNPSTDFITMKSFAYGNKVGTVAPVMTLDLDAKLKAKLGGNLPLSMHQGLVLYVYKLSDRQAPGVLPFSDVKEEAANMVKRQKAMDQFKVKADEIVRLARAGSFANASASQKLELKHFAEQPIAAIQQIPTPQVAQSILDLKPGSISDPLSTGTGWLIVNLTNIADINSSNYELNRADMADAYHNQETPLIYQAWLSEKMTEGQETGKIVVYADRAKDYLAGKYRTAKPTGGSGGYY